MVLIGSLVCCFCYYPNSCIKITLLSILWMNYNIVVKIVGAYCIRP